jgi:hypothetical protein
MKKIGINTFVAVKLTEKAVEHLREKGIEPSEYIGEDGYYRASLLTLFEDFGDLTQRRGELGLDYEPPFDEIILDECDIDEADCNVEIYY